MSYLTTEDLKTFLDERELEAIRRNYEQDGTDKLPVGIGYAENYLKDRIGTRYDMAVEYAKTGADRSTTLLEILSHIAIWKLAASFPTIQLEGKRHYNYEQALSDITKILKGELLTTLPTVTTSTNGAVVWGSTDGLDLEF